jgi:CubicO group peptidase (beta-lactamase class C family)
MNKLWWRPWAVLLVFASLFVPATAQSGMGSELTPERVKAALTQLDNLAQQSLKTTGVPGLAIAVVYKDQVVYLKGFGVREAGKLETVDADTVFQLASVSKPIASTIVAGVVGDRLVRWGRLPGG